MNPDLPRGTSQTSETGRRVSDTEYDTWLTKDQAATAIGGSTKMVERLAAEGKIQQAHRQRQGRGAFRTVYYPDDVARIAATRRAAPQAFVLPAGVGLPANGNGHRDTIAPQTALVSVPPGEDVLRLLFGAALRAVSETSETRGLRGPGRRPRDRRRVVWGTAGGRPGRRGETAGPAVPAQGPRGAVMGDDKDTIHGGGYYGRRTPTSPLVPVPIDAVTREPDAWICRRVVDFPRAQPPAGSAVAKCTRCHVLIAFNPRHVCAAPKVCMQCMKIQPLPIEEAL